MPRQTQTLHQEVGHRFEVTLRVLADGGVWGVWAADVW